MHEIRDRAIRELFDRLTGRGGGAPSDESLRHQLSSADAAAIQDVIVNAVDTTIGGLLFVMDGFTRAEENGPKFEIFTPAGVSVATMSDAIQVEPSGRDGWISKYSEFPR